MKNSHIDDLYFTLDTLHYAQSEICSLFLDMGRGQEYYDNLFYKQAGEAHSKLGILLNELKLERPKGL